MTILELSFLVFVLYFNFSLVLANDVPMVSEGLCRETFQRLPAAGTFYDPNPGTRQFHLYKLPKSVPEDFAYWTEFPPRQGDPDYEVFLRIKEKRHMLWIEFGKREPELSLTFVTDYLYIDIENEIRQVVKILQAREKLLPQ